MKKVIALILAVGLLLTGCGGASRDLMKGVKPSDEGGLITVRDPFSDGFDPETDETWDNALVADFGMRLFRASFKEDQNTLISPMSILAALAMTANGAEGETLSQMETVLGQSRDALNSWYQYGTVYDDNVLNSANAIWFREDVAVEKSFLQTNADCFGAGAYQAPFDDTTVKEINSFVEKNTKGMIPEILREVPSEAVMYLVNALAFEDKWEEEYMAHQIRDGIFTKEDGTRQNVDMMWSEENRYYENDLCMGFRKYYRSGEPNRFAFVALLPKEGVSLQALVNGLDGKHLQEFLAQPEEATVVAAIPEFETEFDVQMGEILEEMGMTDAFDDEKANFSGMGTYAGEDLFISRVLHKTFISVAEQGTRAGAATVVEMAPEAAPPTEPEEIKRVILDRPFLYMIVDTSSNTPIFMGTLMEIQ
jgi:serpin B